MCGFLDNFSRIIPEKSADRDIPVMTDMTLATFAVSGSSVTIMSVVVSMSSSYHGKKIIARGGVIHGKTFGA